METPLMSFLLMVLNSLNIYDFIIPHINNSLDNIYFKKHFNGGKKITFG